MPLNKPPGESGFNRQIEQLLEEENGIILFLKKIQARMLQKSEMVVMI